MPTYVFDFWFLYKSSNLVLNCHCVWFCKSFMPVSWYSVTHFPEFYVEFEILFKKKKAEIQWLLIICNIHVFLKIVTVKTLIDFIAVLELKWDI